MDNPSCLIQTSRQSDEFSEDSGIQSSPSSSKSSTPLKNLKMSKEDIENMIEEAFKKINNPSKKTNKSIQAATGVSIEEINQRLSRKRQLKNQLEAPKKKFQYFPTTVRKKLLESYVPGGGLPSEDTMKVLLKETGLTRTQICNFYSHKKRALKKEAARQFRFLKSDEEFENPLILPLLNAEANAIVNEIKQKMEDDKIQDFLDKLHKEHPSSFTKEETGPTTFLRTKDGRIRYPVPKDSSPEGRNSFDDQVEGKIEPRKKRMLKMTSKDIDELFEAVFQDKFYPSLEIRHELSEMTGMTLLSINARFVRRQSLENKKRAGKVPSELSHSPPRIPEDKIQDFLLNSCKDNIDPRFTDIESWASQIGKSTAWIYQWVKNHRAGQGNITFVGITNMEYFTLKGLNWLRQEYGLDKNPSHGQMEISSVITGRSGLKVFEWVKKRRAADETLCDSSN